MKKHNKKGAGRPSRPSGKYIIPNVGAVYEKEFRKWKIKQKNSANSEIITLNVDLKIKRSLYEEIIKKGIVNILEKGVS